MAKKNSEWTKKAKALFKVYMSHYSIDGESEILLRLAIDYYDLQLRALEELRETGNLVMTGSGGYKPNPTAANLAKYNNCMLATLKLLGIQKLSS
jgi:hypothetical protein